MRRAALVLVAVVATGVAGCSDDAEPPGSDSGSSGSSAASFPSATPTPSAPPTATPMTEPDDGACYRIGYQQAVSPTNGAAAVPCRKKHTSETYAVGSVDSVVAGHLLAVDSARVQRQVAETCPADLGAMVGGSLEEQRLSMLRAVWFTPSLERAAEGASWYRCDVVVLAGADDLATVTGSLRGVLDTPAGRDRYGMCGTAKPDAASFERVLCSAPHAWRAFDVIALEPGRYPGAKAVAEAGAGPCEDAAAGVAADALDYEWAYEGPSREQWRAGQTFIRCWAPSASAQS